MHSIRSVPIRLYAQEISPPHTSVSTTSTTTTEHELKREKSPQPSVVLPNSHTLSARLPLRTHRKQFAERIPQRRICQQMLYSVQSECALPGQFYRLNFAAGRCGSANFSKQKICTSQKYFLRVLQGGTHHFMTIFTSNNQNF